MDNQKTISPKEQIITHFPDYKAEIKSLYFNESFKELVNDFLFCERKLKRFQGLTKVKLANQYAVTLLELRNELLGYLKKQKQL